MIQTPSNSSVKSTNRTENYFLNVAPSAADPQGEWKDSKYADKFQRDIDA